MLTAIVDTNAVASGLMTVDVDAPTARILEYMCSGRIPFVVSRALLAEYREVLSRPKLRKRHGLNHDEIESLLITLAETAIVLQPGTGPKAPEPGDQHLWDLLACRGDLCLVTGDALLIHARKPPSPVLSPADFIAGMPMPV